MYGKIYYVTFEARMKGTAYEYFYHCCAHSADEAKELAKQAWSKDHDAHQFHLYAHRSKAPDVPFLKVTSWKGNTLTGENVIDRFICTDLRSNRRR